MELFEVAEELRVMRKWMWVRFLWGRRGLFLTLLVQRNFEQIESKLG
jgi:hypothetical protein